MGVHAVWKTDENGKRVNTAWRAQYRPARKPPYDECFPPTPEGKADAKVAYERAKEAHRKGYSVDRRAAKAATVGALIERYRTEVVAYKAEPKWDNNRCLNFMNWDFAQLDLTSTQEIQWALQRWRDARLHGKDHRGRACKPVMPETVNRDLGVLGPMFELAIKEWNAPLTGNPAHMIIRPEESDNHRTELWSDDELNTYLRHLKFDWDTNPFPTGDGGRGNGVRYDSLAPYLGWVVMLMRYTGLRLSNCVKLKLGWIDIPRRLIHFPPKTTKNKAKWPCPLTDAGVAIVEKLLDYRLEALGCTIAQARDEQIIPAKSQSICAILGARQKELIALDPRFAELVRHDMRHTFTTELVEQENITDVARLAAMTGRKDWDVLADYIHLNPTKMSHMASGRPDGKPPAADAPKWTPKGFTGRSKLHVVRGEAA